LIYPINIPVTSQEVIIDNEIAKNIADSDPTKDWHYDQAKLTVVGVIYQDKLYQVVLQTDEQTFKEEIRTLLAGLPQPFHAFNKDMEQGNFLGYIGQHYEFREIKPFRGRGWSKARFYEELVKMGLKKPLQDIFNNNSHMAITEWAKGNKKAVMEHNKNCLLKELAILKHKDALIKKYEGKINEKGWLNE